MKNIRNILKRADLSPLERVAALVHNQAHKEKTGKDLLSESELLTITNGWIPRMAQANQYNKYLEIVRLESLMRMDAQMFAQRSELSVIRNQRVLSYWLSDMKKEKGVGIPQR